MKIENFIEAVTILTHNHSNDVIINKSFGNGSNTGHSENPTLHIVNCTGASIDKLKKANFALSMEDGFLSVHDYPKL